jgi:predicted AlkP superfamily pyrophosphatase or phosphodiesterase
MNNTTLLKAKVLCLSFFLFLTTSLTTSRSSILTTSEFKKPKLVVLLVIDQFRADTIQKFKSRFLPAKNGSKVGGFNYLLSQGAYYPYAEYDLIGCMTGPGHATLLSGSYPYQNGVASNDWYDRATGTRMYCAQDINTKTVGANPSKKTVGTSPKNLLSTTVGDELKNAGFQSQVISIALKDRAAIFMGGHRADLALWYDQESMKWVSSEYYLKDKTLPAWVVELNSVLEKNKDKTFEWTPTPSSLNLSVSDPHIIKNDWNTASGLTFPHSTKLNSRGVLRLPYGLEITRDAAKSAITHYALGNHAHPDLLAVSFSSHDYLAHAFGHRSAEIEDMTLHEDKVISELLNHLNTTVKGGLSEVAIVLSADHGGPHNPEILLEDKVPAGRVKIDFDKIERRLKEELGAPKNKKWIAYEADLNYFFDLENFKNNPEKQKKAELILKDELLSTPGIAYAISQTDYKERHLPPGIHGEQVLKTFYPARSGDVVAILKPYYMEYGDTVSHQTGYTYDRMVPMIFTGRFFKSNSTHFEKSKVIDIAPTLSALLGIVPPPLAEGRVLNEALK